MNAAAKRPGEDPGWLAVTETAPALVKSADRALQPGEVHLHWVGLVPALLATLVAFPFEVNPLWSALMAVMVLVVFTVRLHAPRIGRWPVYALHLVILVLAVASLMFAEQVSLAPRSIVGQFVAFAALSVMLLPPQTYRTFTACVVCLMTLVANGLMRTDLEYTFCLGGFLLTLPGLMILGHAHESVRARGVAWRARSNGRWGKALASLRRTAESLVTVGAGLALFAVLPKPAVMPISDGRFAGVANSFQDGVDVGRGPIPRGGQPFLYVEAKNAPYLLGQVFDKYDLGRWSRTPAVERTLLNRGGSFALPAGLDSEGGRERVTVRLTRELPDLLLLPEGTRQLECASWHVLGNPPLHLRAWVSSPLTTYSVQIAPPVRLSALGAAHAPVGGEKAAAAWGKGPEVKQVGDGPPATTRWVPPGTDARVRELAREWTRGCATDVEKVRALFARLGERCRYDTAALTPRGADPVTHLLFESRAGYCMHFATALAVLCRIAGVPARLATGYAPGSALDRSKPREFAVRPRDAHAWTHVWLEGHGWVSVDATEGIMQVSYRDSAEDFLAGDPLSPAAGVTLDLPVLRSASRAASRVSAFAQANMATLIALVGAAVVLGAFVAWWRSRKESDADEVAVEATSAFGRSKRARGRSASGGSGPDRGTAGGPADETGTERAGAHAGVASPLDPGARRAALSDAFDSLCAKLAARGWPARAASSTPREHARALATAAAPPGQPPVNLGPLAELVDQVVLGPQPAAPDLLARAESELARF